MVTVLSRAPQPLKTHLPLRLADWPCSSITLSSPTCSALAWRWLRWRQSVSTDPSFRRLSKTLADGEQAIAHRQLCIWSRPWLTGNRNSQTQCTIPGWCTITLCSVFKKSKVKTKSWRSMRRRQLARTASIDTNRASASGKPLRGRNEEVAIAIAIEPGLPGPTRASSNFLWLLLQFFFNAPFPFLFLWLLLQSTPPSRTQVNVPRFHARVR